MITQGHVLWGCCACFDLSTFGVAQICSALRQALVALQSAAVEHCLSVQLELHAHEQLDKAWRRLAKRDAKAAQSDSAHVPAAKQPEAVFLPEMLDEFLQVSCKSCIACTRAAVVSRCAQPNAYQLSCNTSFCAILCTS